MHIQSNPNLMCSSRVILCNRSGEVFSVEAIAGDQNCQFFLLNGLYLFVSLSVFGAAAPQWARASSFMRFLDYTQ